MVRTEKYISLKQLQHWDELLDLGIEKQSVKKGDLFLQQGQACNYFFFIEKGLMRMYYYDLQGNEVTHFFSAQNMMITSPSSFFQKEENFLFFEALEDCELLLVTLDHINKISKEVEGFSLLFTRMIIGFTISLSRRIMSIHTESAEYRYLKLIKEYPTIFRRSKLSHVASYLGITQQSLSRIRKKLIN